MTDNWTSEQNKRFEQALAVYWGEEEKQQLQEGEGGEEAAGAGRWKKIAAMVPGKSPADIWRHYRRLLEDVAAIEAGKVAIPNYREYGSGWQPGGSWEERLSKGGGGPKAGTAAAAAAAATATTIRASEQERKKGIPWTEEEHRLFLLGLEKFGKGDWRSISRNFVVSRTPTQVASHAQKYFIRLNSINKDKRRSSIHDITNAATVAMAAAPPPPHFPPMSFAPPPPKMSRHQ